MYLHDQLSKGFELSFYPQRKFTDGHDVNSLWFSSEESGYAFYSWWGAALATLLQVPSSNLMTILITLFVLQYPFDQRSKGDSMGTHRLGMLQVLDKDGRQAHLLSL